ncbi:MAG: DNRLRE domain-containing protein [Burkholderiales bacterium]
MRALSVALFLAASVALIRPALAAPATLGVTASQDTSIFFGTPAAPTLSDGSGDNLWLSVTAEGLGRRLLVKFDVSAIPTGATIRSVTLSLYQSRSRDNHDVTVHRLLASWGEGASNAGSAGTGAPAAAGDATWVNRFHPATAWTTPGGDFDPASSAVTLVGPPDLFYSWAAAVPEGGGPIPRLVSDVQAWVNAPASNHGWILIGKETGSQNAKRFQSRNNSLAENRPRLTVVYDPPPPAGEDGDVPLPAWALALLALILLRIGMARTDHG